MSRTRDVDRSSCLTTGLPGTVDSLIGTVVWLGPLREMY